MEERYYSVSTIPSEITATNTVCRMLTGIGFRFYWATFNLTEETYSFKSTEGARTIGETVEHVWNLLNWIYGAISSPGKTKPNGAIQLRQETLKLIAILEDSFSVMDNKKLASIRLVKDPFWSIINGPLSDVLTHIGQIATLRRMAGFPAPNSNPFEGTPPPEMKSKV
jgi:hypothetical protein